jgi:hypothetical protein
MGGGSDGCECTAAACALANSAGRPGPLLDGTPETFDASTRLYFTLVGVPVPAGRDEWPALIEAAAAEGGTAEAVRGLELAARQPPIAPASAEVGWWTAADQRRAEAIAAIWRQSAQGGNDVEREAA